MWNYVKSMLGGMDSTQVPSASQVNNNDAGGQHDSQTQRSDSQTATAGIPIQSQPQILTREKLNQHDVNMAQQTGVRPPPPEYRDIGQQDSVGASPTLNQGTFRVGSPVNILNQDYFGQTSLGFSKSGKILDLVSLNLLGPFTETVSASQFILAITDCATGDAEAYPLCTRMPEDIAYVIVNDYVASHGIIGQLYSDQGRVFDDELIKSIWGVLDQYGESHHGSSAYQAAGNTYVNHMLKNRITCMVRDHPQNWDSILPYIIHKYRKSLSRIWTTQPSAPSVLPAVVPATPTPSVPSVAPVQTPPMSSTPHPQAPRREDIVNPGVSPVPTDPIARRVHFSPSLPGVPSDSTSSDPSSYHTAPDSVDNPHPNMIPSIPIPAQPNVTLGTMHTGDLTQSLHEIIRQNAAQNKALQQTFQQIVNSVVEKQHPQDNFKMKPEIFTGENWEWDDYITHFEEVARCNNWTEKRKGAILGSSIKGLAIAAWRDKFPDMPPSTSYPLLVATMRDRFNPKGMIEAHKATFQAAIRKPDQTIMEYAYTLRRLAINAYPGHDSATREDTVKDHFLRTLEDRTLRTHVTMAHPETLEQAIGLATEYVTLNKDVIQPAPRKPVAPILNPHANSFTPQSVTPSGTPMNPVGAASVDLDQLADTIAKKMRQQRRPVNNRQCWTCHQEGHMQRQCPQRNMQGHKPFGATPTTGTPLAPLPATSSTVMMGGSTFDDILNH